MTRHGRSSVGERVTNDVLEIMEHLKEATVPPDARDYEIRIWHSAEKGDECFIAQVVAWPGIIAHGDTREEAARQIQLALEGALEAAAKSGIAPPAPAMAHAS